MSNTLTTRLVRMGNSQGIRLPKLLIDQIGLGADVQIEVQSDHLIVRPARVHPRDGWEAQFQIMAAHGDDRLLDAEDLTPTQWDKDEWVW